MTIRFLQRHAQQSVVEFLKTGLDDLGWVQAPVNFGEPPLIFREVERMSRVERIDPNTLSVVVDRESADRLAELGGPRYRTELTFLADVYGSSPSVTVSIASDIKDLVRDRTIRIFDFSGSTPVQTDALVEFDEAHIDRPLGDVNALEFKGVWRIVRLYAFLDYEGV